jgi:peptidyl-prolyl cis-trans isomerase SurA
MTELPLCRPLPARLRRLGLPLALAATLGLALPAAAQNLGRTPVRNGDWIAVVVNQELVTAGEVDRRYERAVAEAGRAGQRLPPEAELRKQALDALIDERAMLSSARDSGMRVDEAELDRAVQNIAAQNQLTLPQLRERLTAEGIDYPRFRANVRDQLMIERLREREVYGRIRVKDEEIDAWLAERQTAANADADTNLAQILVTVPDGADPATLAERERRAAAALARVKAGEAFDAVAREVSEDPPRACPTSSWRPHAASNPAR